MNPVERGTIHLLQTAQTYDTNFEIIWKEWAAETQQEDAERIFDIVENQADEHDTQFSTAASAGAKGEEATPAADVRRAFWPLNPAACGIEKR